ncbi:MAG TPA: alanine/ornithine racemase family PLP-dependent enzyme [Bacteriovoracaceae bacterium]|nr:alanine/ornithine racemase family PLP-dependent enzyme [Bacteriovoracaceae bacterium]
MAKLYLYRDRLRHNFDYLEKQFKEADIEWAIVTKLLCGNKVFLKEILDLAPAQVCDSRISNLKTVKEINPNIETVYIKPPAQDTIKNLVRYASISLNTQYETIQEISREALKQKKRHKIILMVEMGDLREGILGEELESFCDKIFKLKGIEVIGLGTNFNCLHGVMPSQEKLEELCIYKKRIEKKFNVKLPLISGGTSVTLPLLLKSQPFPREVNHFRVGEALFFGVDLFSGKTIKGMYPFTFELEAQVIEVSKKPDQPFGDLGTNPMGFKFDKKQGEASTVERAILDIGILDVAPQFLIPKNKRIKVMGASSDMLVVDITKSRHKYPVGSTMKFELKYMGALSLLNSRYVEKVVL